jgi:ribosome-associated protein
MHDDETEHDGEAIEFVSKSQIKREMHALQEMGAQLVELNDDQLAKLPLGDKLLAAILESRNIKQHIARKRHLKHIGKLLREEDAEAIRSGLEVLFNQDKAATARFHRMEQWRDRLIAEGDGALAEFINEYPTADRQQLRQLIRNAQREATANKPPKSARQLFKLIRELVEQA